MLELSEGFRRTMRILGRKRMFLGPALYRRAASKRATRTVEHWLRTHQPFDLVIHAGAHLCQEAALYEELGANTVVWIEADPVVLPRTRSAVDDRKLARHLVVGATLDLIDGPGSRIYRFSNDGAATSIFPPAPGFKSHWPEISVTDFGNSLPKMRLASALQSVGVTLDGAKRNLLVLDIQGNELSALSGMSADEFRRLSAVVSEVTFGPSIYKGGASARQVIALLRMNELEPVTAFPAFHGDVVFARK